MIIEYNKLVRDKIPDMIRADGKTPYTHRVSGLKKEQALQDKLVEEVKEFQESKSIEELGDILDVVEKLISYGKLQPMDRDAVYCVAANYGIQRKELDKVRKEKAEEKGGFDLGIILEKVESKPSPHE